MNLTYSNFPGDMRKFCSDNMSRKNCVEAIAFAYQMHRKILAEKEAEFNRRLAEQEKQIRKELAKQ